MVLVVLVVGGIVFGQLLIMIISMMSTIVKLMNVMMFLALFVIMLYKFMMFLLIYGIQINIMQMKELGIFMLMLR